MASQTFDHAPDGLRLSAKAVLPSVPIIGSLPFVKPGRHGDLHDVEIRRTGVTTDPRHLARYGELCGFGRSVTLPVTYPHLGAHGLQLRLMTDAAFPFSPLGAIHVRHRITQRRPIGREETYDVVVRASPPRPHRRGHLVDLVSEVLIDADPVWSEVMTLLFREDHAEPVPAVAPPLAGVEPPEGVLHWKLSGDLGRRYAMVSGDGNPIHLHPLTAKAFGMPRHVAHGMWTLAHSLASLQTRLPESFVVDVEFTKPIFLPRTVLFGIREDPGAIVFAVTGTPKPVTHLLGRVTPA